MVEYKFCNKCGMVKDVNEFYNDKSKADGKRTICKECSQAPKMSSYDALKLMLEGNWIFDVFEDDIVGEILYIPDDTNYIAVYKEGNEIAIEVTRPGYDGHDELVHYKHYKRPAAAFSFINSVMTRN